MSKADYALLWANGATFGEVYDLMEADILARWGPPEPPTLEEWDGTALKVGVIPTLTEDVKEVRSRVKQLLAADFGYADPIIAWADEGGAVVSGDEG